jgi:hypothetical protein
MILNAMCIFISRTHRQSLVISRNFLGMSSNRSNIEKRGVVLRLGTYSPLFSILLLFPLIVICQWQLSHHDGYSSFQQQVVMFNTMSIVISSTQYPLFNHWSFSHGNEFTDPHINITSIPLVFILSMANLAS